MKRFLCALVGLLALMPALALSPGTYLLNAVTTTGAGAQFPWRNYYISSFQASVTGGGTASVNVEATQDPAVGWNVLDTLSLSSGTPMAVYTATPAYPYVRGNVTALSGGTTPAVSLSMYPQ